MTSSSEDIISRWRHKRIWMFAPKACRQLTDSKPISEEIWPTKFTIGIPHTDAAPIPYCYVRKAPWETENNAYSSLAYIIMPGIHIRRSLANVDQPECVVGLFAAICRGWPKFAGVRLGGGKWRQIKGIRDSFFRIILCRTHIGVCLLHLVLSFVLVKFQLRLKWLYLLLPRIIYLLQCQHFGTMRILCDFWNCIRGNQPYGIQDTNIII